MRKNILFLLTLFNFLHGQQAPIGLQWTKKEQLISNVAYLKFTKESLEAKKLKDKLTLQNGKYKLKMAKKDLKIAKKELKKEKNSSHNERTEKIKARNKEPIPITRRPSQFIRL